MTSKAELSRAWREANPERVAAYNAARRMGPFPRVCDRCGFAFAAFKREQTRCKPCVAVGRRERDRERKRRVRAMRDIAC